LTIGTLDGANVEMHEVLGDENMFLFGLHADEVTQLKYEGYVPQRLYNRDAELRRCLDALRTGFRDGVTYEDLYQRLLFGMGGSQADEYLLLADFQSYCNAEKRMVETYADKELWNRMSIHNIARSGIFAADRAVAEYADNIWHASHR
jgi:starch phosphorylase